MSAAVLLVGGQGTRLSPLTNYTNKHLLPLAGYPVFYYPLCTLISLGVDKLIFVCNPGDYSIWQNIGADLVNAGLFDSVKISVQNSPEGIPHGLLLAEPHLKAEKSFTLMLGDNVFLSQGQFCPALAENSADHVVYTTAVEDYARFGTVRCAYGADLPGVVFREKDITHRGRAVTGLYTFKRDMISYLDEETVFDAIRGLEKSERGEYEITGLLNYIARREDISVLNLGPSNIWMDVGSVENLSKADRTITALREHNILVKYAGNVLFAKMMRLVGTPKKLANYLHNCTDADHRATSPITVLMKLGLLDREYSTACLVELHDKVLEINELLCG